MGLNSGRGFDFSTTKLDTIINYARSKSLWPMPFGVACCAIEMMASYMPKYDTSRFGEELSSTRGGDHCLLHWPQSSYWLLIINS